MGYVTSDRVLLQLDSGQRAMEAGGRPRGVPGTGGPHLAHRFRKQKYYK